MSTPANRLAGDIPQELADVVGVDLLWNLGEITVVEIPQEAVKVLLVEVDSLG